MVARLLIRLLLPLFLLTSLNASADDQKDPVYVRLDTSEGAITLRLRPDQAPATVANFLNYVRSGFYKGTLFHRVIPGFMIQGGGFNTDLQQKQTQAPVNNESDNDLQNTRGTIAMARTSDPDSATAQFFINLVDNAYLNGRPGKPGYTVFGKVTTGMDVVDSIARVPTTTRGGLANVPRQPVVITGAEVIDTPAQ